MQASLNDTSLDVNPPPSIIAWLASIKVWACDESSGTPRARDNKRIFALPDWPFTPMETCEDLVRILDQTPLLAGALREAVMNGNAKALFKPGT